MVVYMRTIVKREKGGKRACSYVYSAMALGRWNPFHLMDIL